MPQPQALEKKQPSPVARVRQTLEHHAAMIAKVAANRIKPEQLVSVAIQCMTQTPKLLDCDPLTVAGALVNASRLGLVPDPALRQCALVPRWSKHRGALVCHLWIQVGGWVQLVKRADRNIRLEAKTVRQADEFEYEYGTQQFLRHRILKPRSQRGEITHTYAIAHFPHGGAQFAVLDLEDIERIRAVSDARDSNFWQNWYEEMAQAKAGKALCKWLAVSTEEAQLAVGLDDQMDANVLQTSPIDSPETLEGAARQVLEKKVAQAEKAGQTATQLNPEILSPETQQAVSQAAHSAGVPQDRAVSMMLDIQLEAERRLNEQEGSPAQIYQDVAAQVAKLINTYSQQMIERQRAKKPSAMDQAKAAQPEPKPHSQPTGEHPWKGTAPQNGPQWNEEPAPPPSDSEEPVSARFDPGDQDDLAAMFR